MGNQIIVYNANFPQKSGSFFISQKPKRPRIIHWLGIFFLALSFVGIAIFFLPMVTEELNYRLHYFQRQVLQKQEGQLRSKFSLILSPDDNQFELIIPKVGINTQVVINVDPGNKTEYDEILKDHAAHAMGSSLPGEGGMVYVFGHSTNSIFDLAHYNPVFYLLKELNIGDEVGIIHQGSVYFYQVKEKKVLETNEVASIMAEIEQEKLILQTCWPPGTTWKRLLVIAYPERKT